MDVKVVFVLCLCFWAFKLHEAARKKFILVMLDGCRWDYINNDTNLKGIPRIIKNGVRAPFVYPIYPSISYPNWYTIVTGLFPENHGFVGNDMYDPKTNKFFVGNVTDHTGMGAAWWNEAEPVWITGEKNDSKAALYWWAGCEINIGGRHPMICERHRYGPGTEEEKNDFLHRMDDLVSLFQPSRTSVSKDGSGGLAMALMYYGPLDWNGHEYGPDAKETRQSLYNIDEILDKMQSKLKKAGLENEVNIMVVSDHGMADVKEYIDIDKFAPDIKYQVGRGAISMIMPEDGKLDKLFTDIDKANLSGLKVFKKEDIPSAYNLKNNDKVLPIFLQAATGFYIKAVNDSSKRIGGPSAPLKGNHGYDPYVDKDMRTIFLATGPDFKKGYETPTELHNYDFYNLMCHITGIQPLPNNGSWDRVKSMLVNNDYKPLVAEGNAPVGSFIVISFSFLFIVTSFILAF